jgi:hypothetical protein
MASAVIGQLHPRELMASAVSGYKDPRLYAAPHEASLTLPTPVHFLQGAGGNEAFLGRLLLQRQRRGDDYCFLIPEALMHQVINVEGPSVAMAAPYIAHDPAMGRPVAVSVDLQGPSALPVAATLALSQRYLDAGELVFLSGCAS